MSQDHMTWFDWFLVIAGLACVLALTSCASKREEKAQTDTVRHETTVLDFSIPFPTPQADGTIRLIEYPVHVTMVRDSTELAKTDATRTTTVSAPELGLAVKAALAQFAPGLAVLAQPQKPAGGDHTGELITGGSALAILIAKMLADRAKEVKAREVIAEKDRQIEFHKAEATEGWNRALEKENNVRPS